MTDDRSAVSLAELREAIEVLLRGVEATAGDTLTLEKDLFWSVPVDDLYDPLKEPSPLGIGQLSESWGHVRQMLTDTDHALGYHLIWLADVLRAIGSQVPVFGVREGGAPGE